MFERDPNIEKATDTHSVGDLKRETSQVHSFR